MYDGEAVMKVLYKNKGTYEDYALSGTVLSFRNGDLALDIAELERDHPVNLTVYEDAEGLLSQTPGEKAQRYMAEINIPARKSLIEKTGVVDQFGYPVLRRVYPPTGTDDIVLTLWAKGDR